MERRLPHGGPQAPENPISAPPTYERLVIVVGTTMIILDPATLPSGKTMQPREVTVCENGVTKTMWILATEPS